MISAQPSRVPFAPCSLKFGVHSSRMVLALALLGVVAPLLRGEEPIRRLVRLVGRDAGLCVELPQLDATVSQFEGGEFFQRLEHSHLYADWRGGPSYHQVSGILSAIEGFSGKPFRQFFREIFGSAVVVAVYPEGQSRMSAILLSEALNREVLDSAIEGWNRAESQHTDTLPFAGREYYRRTCTKRAQGGRTLYYCKLERTFVLSDHEDWIKRSLMLAQDTASHDSLVDLPAYQQARRSLQKKSVARVYINPRAWDSVLGLSPAAPPTKTAMPAGTQATASGPALSAPLEAAWRRCEWLALGLQLDRGVVLEATLRYSNSGQCSDCRQVIDSMKGPAEFLKVVPENALVVVAGRQAFGRLLRQTLPLDPKNKANRQWDSFRKVSRGLLLGWDLFDEVLPALGENWGAYVTPRAETKRGELPLDGVVAVQLPGSESAVRKPNPDQSRAAAPAKPPLRDAIDNGLTTGLNLVAAYFNIGSVANPAVVHSESKSGLRLRWIESLGPYRPSFGMTNGYLVFATRPQAVQSFAQSETKSSPLPNRVPQSIAQLAGQYFRRENQLLFIDVAGIRRFVQTRGKELLEHGARVRSLAADEVTRQLDEFLDVATLFDTVFVAARLDSETARVVIGGIESVEHPVTDRTGAAAASASTNPR